ncbi:MAG TPA: hotdog family protein [Paraburkholderia sp.]|jgi:predicted hotdog family 3-hydroxylacyl-ACP dehydratase|nr:hotdog family protein [Paraburkholderia sp.]
MTSPALPATPLPREWIAAHIPHAGAMCLLDEVVAWDDERIRCIATSHRDPRNPLRANGRLAAVNGIEYAAQAMAVHGAVLGAARSRPRVGFLASVRNVDARVERLDDVDGPLTIDAERMSGDGNHLLYRFTIGCGERVLLTGRAAVLLDAES